MFLDVIALIGSLAFAISAAPAAYAAYKAGTCTYNKAFLALWGIGEICYIFYMTATAQPLLLVNYVPNFLCLLVIMHYNNRKV